MPGKHQTPRRSSKWLLITVPLLILPLAIAGVLLHRGSGTLAAAPVTENHKTAFTVSRNTPEPSQEPVVYTAYAHFAVPGDEILEEGTGDTPEVLINIPNAPAYDGYTFLGWQAEDGSILFGDTVPVTGEASFAALYNVSLKKDADDPQPYLDLSDDGFFFPERPVTRGQAALVIADMLALPAYAEKDFQDVTPSSPYYLAVSALKQLGAAVGDNFRPDDPITTTELISILAPFTPYVPEQNLSLPNVSTDREDYSNWLRVYAQGWISEDLLPDIPMTRLAFAEQINTIKGRPYMEGLDYSSAGGIMDLPAGSRDYAVAVEASVPHTVEVNDGTVTSWTAETTLPTYEPGFLRIGTTLYYIQEDGLAAKNTTIKDRFQFDADGHYTSGDEELDAEVDRFLSEIMDKVGDDLEPERLLYEIFKGICYDGMFFYVKGDVYDPGTTDWAIDCAKAILESRTGNCFNYAAGFWALARGIGFDCRVISGRYQGTPGGRITNHAWTEIYYEGEPDPYTFDPQLQWNLYRYMGLYDVRWKMRPSVVRVNSYFFPENYQRDPIEEGETT